MSLATRLLKNGGEFIAPAASPVEELRAENAVLRKDIAAIRGELIEMRRQLKDALAAIETVSKQSQPVSKPCETSLRKSQAQKPWEAEGISKASWYRRKKESTHA